MLEISHTRFVIAFPALLYAVCNALNAGKLAKWFQQNDGLNVWAFGAYLIAGLCLFIAFFCLFAHRRTIKPLAILLTVLSAAATYFIRAYDVAIDSTMLLNTAHTDPVEVGQLLSMRMIPYILFLLALPVAVIVSLTITFARPASYLFASAQVLLVSLGIAVVCLYANANAIIRAGNVSNKYIVYSLVPVNLISGTFNVAAHGLAPLLSFHGALTPISARIGTPGNLVVVLAIGESSRQKNFSLYGYDRRNTTPVLSAMTGLQVLNGRARRGSTINALPQILEKHETKLPAVVAKAGVPTSCLVNYTLYDNCASVGEIAAKDCAHDGKCYDEDVIPLLAAKLATHASGYEFIVLHLGGGSHGPIYRDRHPPEFLRFQPTCTDADIANRCTREQVYNSYDNTILYVDHVVGGLIESLDRSALPYVFLYLSDHGESLMDNGVMFHGMPPGIALPPEQAAIPLIVKASVPISVEKREEYEQTTVFDTVLDLLSIQSPLLDGAASFIHR